MKHRNLRCTGRNRWTARGEGGIGGRVPGVSPGRAPAPLAGWPLADLTRAHVQTWVTDLRRVKATKAGPGGARIPTGRRLARQTVVHALNLVRVALEAAVAAGHLKANPARDVRVPKEPRSDEGWTYLTAAEIDQVLTSEAVPEPARVVFTVAIYAGLRAGELWGLRWQDVRLDGDRPEILVARSYDGPTKSGKPRHVPLLAPARAGHTARIAASTPSPMGPVVHEQSLSQGVPGSPAETPVAS